MNLVNESNKESFNIVIAPKHITSEGAFRLVKAILENAYSTYSSALKTIMEIGKKTPRTKKEEVLLINAFKDKKYIENFYKSKLFELYTLGKSVSGEEVIKKIQSRVGFKEEGEELL